ncbi:MAG: CDGSH iron-sulfur domain-containing protein, partial [Betaproteobacteria bacterium]|nr:CDGSH iron-sulfur domain-containing protein [Betaproteobacteria bacterium]
MADATIEILKDGPLRVTGIKQCRNSRGEAIAVEETIYLCRCGGSQKKPFCDGTHKKKGFSGKRERSGPHEPTKDYSGRDIT